MKEKIRTTSFWLGLSGACVLVTDCVADIFGINICSGTVEKVVMTVASVLVMLGIITKKNVGDKACASSEDLLKELQEENFDIDDN